MTDIEQIKETLSKMQAQIDVLEDKFNCVNPQCFLTPDYPLSLSAARSMWPMLEHEFDRYCTEHEITVWTPEDSTQFYNTYVRIRCRLAIR